jgi:hypothetical protein
MGDALDFINLGLVTPDSKFNIVYLASFFYLFS